MSLFDELFDQVPGFGYTQQDIAAEQSELMVPKDYRDEADSLEPSPALGKKLNIETVRIRQDGRRIDLINEQFLPTASLPVVPSVPRRGCRGRSRVD